MNENEPGQLGNREIITVCIAVSLAVILVASLMPAMMPASEDDSELYVTNLSLTSGSEYETVFMYYNDTEIAELNLTGLTAYFELGHPLLIRENASTSEAKTIATADLTITSDIPGYVFTATTPSEFINSPLFVGPNAFLSGSVSPTAPSNTPDFATLVWESFFLNSGFDDGIEKKDPSDSGVDTNTVIVMAIITIIFLGIALTALRTVLPGRGGQRCLRETRTNPDSSATARSSRSASRFPSR